MTSFPSRTLRHVSAGALLLAIALIAAMASPARSFAQPPENNSNTTAQLVDSRKGYVLRIPAEARLDSGASGWSRKRLHEIRVYRLPSIGMIRVIATVRPITIPRDTINNGSYTYTQMDSATERGSAVIRTYYLPTRSVRIELIPLSMRMSRYIEAAQEIFATFRWKPGANSEIIDTE